MFILAPVKMHHPRSWGPLSSQAFPSEHLTLLLHGEATATKTLTRHLSLERLLSPAEIFLAVGKGGKAPPRPDKTSILPRSHGALFLWATQLPGLRELSCLRFCLQPGVGQLHGAAPDTRLESQLGAEQSRFSPS